MGLVQKSVASTDRIHARGPVGLEGLTNQKWIVFGEGAGARLVQVLFGGTFDPVHDGHVMMVGELIARLPDCNCSCDTQSSAIVSSVHGIV